MSNNNELSGALLAASIHEIKNRFGLIFTHLDQLLGDLDISEQQQHNSDKIKSEAEFISNELIRVLAGYKSLSDDCPVNIDQQFLYDFLEDTWARHGYTQKGNQVTIKYECDEDLTGFFDPQVLTIILDTAIYNSIKAGAKTILLTAEESDDQSRLMLVVEDDGPGFPAEMKASGFSQGSISVESNSTGLGLFFANKLIQSHKEGDNCGYIELGDGAHLSGARLSVIVPQ